MTDGSGGRFPDVEFAPRQILSDEVYSTLRALIVEGTIAPGTRIKIEDAAQRLRVSPTPVREALARLESDELVEKLPLKGYRTTSLLSVDELAELYDLRLMLEPPTASRAAERVTAAYAESLLSELETGRRAIDADNVDSYHDLAQHDARLHDLVFAVAGNETARQAYARTHCHLHTFRLAFAQTSGHRTIAEHADIVTAITAGDPTAAGQAMLAHIERSRGRMLSEHGR